MDLFSFHLSTPDENPVTTPVSHYFVYQWDPAWGQKILLQTRGSYDLEGWQEDGFRNLTYRWAQVSECKSIEEVKAAIRAPLTKGKLRKLIVTRFALDFDSREEDDDNLYDINDLKIYRKA